MVDGQINWALNDANMYILMMRAARDASRRQKLGDVVFYMDKADFWKGLLPKPVIGA